MRGIRGIGDMSPQMQGNGDSVVSTDFYSYGAYVSTLAVNSSQTTSIQIEADSDFEIIKLTYSAFDDVNTAITAATNPVPIANILLTDTGSGRQLMNIPIPIASLFGTAELPFILPKSKILFARSVLALTFYNLSGAVAYDRIAVTFHGRKIFNRG